MIIIMIIMIIIIIMNIDNNDNMIIMIIMITMIIMMRMRFQWGLTFRMHEKVCKKKMHLLYNWILTNIPMAMVSMVQMVITWLTMVLISI